MLAAPASAAAEPVVKITLARAAVRYESPHTVKGTLTDGTTGLGGQEVVLEGRRYPYEGSYRVIERGTTDADGSFEFKTELDRNHRLRVSAPAQLISSKYVQAYTLPGF